MISAALVAEGEVGFSRSLDHVETTHLAVFETLVNDISITEGSDAVSRSSNLQESFRLAQFTLNCHKGK